MTNSPKHPHSDSVRTFKAGLAAVRRRRRFIPVRETGGYANELRGLLAALDPDMDPRTGVELVAAFYRADAAVFNACDDSNGSVGDVFRMDARDRFAHYASSWDDKDTLSNLVFDLLEDDDYGVRDSVLDHVAGYLPEATLRTLAEREWNAASVVPIGIGSTHDYARVHHLILVQVIARQLNDPRLLEKAVRAYSPTMGTAACVWIARGWLAAGDADTALQWLERIPGNEHFKWHERDELLDAIYRQLGRRDDLERLLWRRFNTRRTTGTLQVLLDLIGHDRRERVLSDATNDISRDTEFDSIDATFLLKCARADDAARYVIKHRTRLNGDYWESLVPLAHDLESASQPLAATAVYRALLESILARAQTRTYGHGARYLHRLGKLAEGIRAWMGVIPHNDYVASLRERHARKSSFWERVSPGPDG